MRHSDYRDFLVSVFHHVSDTYNIRLGLKYTEIPSSGQISHAFSDHPDSIVLVRTVAFSQKIIFNSSYTEKNNYFLLNELIQDLLYV